MSSKASTPDLDFHNLFSNTFDRRLNNVHYVCNVFRRFFRSHSKKSSISNSDDLLSPISIPSSLQFEQHRTFSGTNNSSLIQTDLSSRRISLPMVLNPFRRSIWKCQFDQTSDLAMLYLFIGVGYTSKWNISWQSNLSGMWNELLLFRLIFFPSQSSREIVSPCWISIVFKEKLVLIRKEKRKSAKSFGEEKKTIFLT